MAQRLSTKTVTTAIQEMLEDGQLGSDPISYIGRDIGHGTRYVFKDSHVALGPREALAYVNTIANREHMGS